MNFGIDDKSWRADVVWIDDSAERDDFQRAPAADIVEFTIGELAREFGTTLRTLRFYENKGLMAPRRDGLARRYRRTDRDRLAVILEAKELGFTLAQIRVMMAAEAPDGSCGGLKLSPEKCREQIEVLETQQREVEAALAKLRQIHSELSTGIAADERSVG